MFAALLLAAAVPFTATAAPSTPPSPRPCTNRSTPPPPVDTSEKPPPGQHPPAPLPVPPTPIGGPRMGECRIVLQAGAPRAPKQLTAASWILVDLHSGKVLAAKDPHARHRPASLIKVLLALVVIDELPPEDIVVPTKLDAKQECTCAGIKAGQRYPVSALLASLLMMSGNDVAHALGTALGGVPTALDKMNALAAQLGALDTRAATPSGLDGPGMSSSAYDLGVIFQHAMRQPRFAKAVRTRELGFRVSEREPPITLYNDNRLLREYRGFLGGKTGFTDDSRHTYVGAAERDGHKLAVVLLRAEQRPIKVSAQASKLLDYGFRLARTDPAPVGHLVEPSDATLIDDAATDERSEESRDGSGGVLALLLTAAALLGILALRRPGRRAG